MVEAEAVELPAGARPLSGKFYVQAQEVFRRATDQNDRMLEATLQITRGTTDMRMLSVGSGSGLYELPFLEALRAAGTPPRRFVGVDPNRRAVQKLDRALQRRFAGRLDFEVRAETFQKFEARERFDLVAFNHTFEYLKGDHRRWIRKAFRMVDRNGLVLIFSPLRGGINSLYSAFARTLYDHAVVFADDLHRLLAEIELVYRVQRVEAVCDISALAGGPENPDFYPLLSFLTQIDCRDIAQKDLSGIADCFLSLREPGDPTISHPAELFLIPGRDRS